MSPSCHPNGLAGGDTKGTRGQDLARPRLYLVHRRARRPAGTGGTVAANRICGTQSGDCLGGSGRSSSSATSRTAAGAKVVVVAASSPDLHGVTGRFYMKSKERKSTTITHDQDLAGRL
jgi:hypothetical protein